MTTKHQHPYQGEPAHINHNDTICENNVTGVEEIRRDLLLRGTETSYRSFALAPDRSFVEYVSTSRAGYLILQVLRSPIDFG